MHDHDDFIHVYCIWRVKSMYYILLLSQMSKLQFCSECNYAAIFQLNSLPGNIFLASDWDFLGGNWENRRLFWIGNRAYIRPLVIGRKGPGNIYVAIIAHLKKHMFFCGCVTYFCWKILFFKIIFQEYHQSVEQLGPDQAQHYVGPDQDPNCATTHKGKSHLCF